MSRPKTIFCDIDGTLVTHSKPTEVSNPNHKMTLLEGTHNVLNEWDRRGYNIVLTTGRKESLRETTEKQLQQAGIIYDQLVMGIGGGDRVLVNDRKDSGRRTAWAVVPDRNKGLKQEVFFNLSEIANQYFKFWGEKNLDGLRTLLSENVRLKDWEQDVAGIEKVLKSNSNIFTGIQNLGVSVETLSHINNTVFCKITVLKCWLISQK